MALKVIIELNGKTARDIRQAIAEVSNLLGTGYLSGYNENNTGDYRFDVTGEDEDEE